MKLINVKSGSSGEAYELWEDNKNLAGISFSAHTDNARVVSDLGKRLFFFEKKGTLTPRTIIKNEYGIKMGEVEQEKAGSKMSHVELDGKHYYYSFNENNSGELKVFDETMRNRLLSCSLKTFAAGIGQTNSSALEKLPNLLLVLCWYAFHAGVPVQPAYAV
jgi:hypothetical protein